MKKILVFVIFNITILKASADEGMWLPMLLGEQVYADMVKKGLKLTKEQLYSINKSSLKDAIVIFNGTYTGEMVSDKGLLFTNYHRGQDVTVEAGTAENNYLKNGYYAYNKTQEIKSGLTVQFLDRMVDVTNEVEAALKGLAWNERIKKTSEVYKVITDKVADKENGLSGTIYNMFKGNQFILCVYKTYRDIRLVAIPPEKAVKFGNETGKRNWPRYAANFSVYRVYASKEGKPVDYNMENIPLKPKYFLPISIKGVKNGDYAMVYGYPRFSNRYETSYSLKLKLEVETPSMLELWDIRLRLMSESMSKDTAVKSKLGSNYEALSNGHEFLSIEKKQLMNPGILSQKQNQEIAFLQWAKGKPEYENILEDYSKNYKTWTPYSKHRIYLTEGILGSPLIAFASSLMALEANIVKTGVSPAEIKKSVTAANEARKAFLKIEDRAGDEKLIAIMARKFLNEIDKSQHPIGFYEGLKAGFGDLKEESTFKKWAKDVFAKTIIIDDAKWARFVSKPDAVILQEDPAFAFASTFVKSYYLKYASLYTTFSNKNEELGRTYQKGILEMNTAEAKKIYPDANLSMRLSYGNVKNYSPRDGILYDFVSTANGIIEKHTTGDKEFDFPSKEIELMKRKDLGQYIDKAKNDLVVNFITNNDIGEGNEGSPVIDANGNLTGITFDGNYDALSHQIAYDGKLNRTICVDIRYVLWCIDKVGGAANIISELKLIKN